MGIVNILGDLMKILDVLDENEHVSLSFPKSRLNQMYKRFIGENTCKG